MTSLVPRPTIPGVSRMVQTRAENSRMQARISLMEAMTAQLADGDCSDEDIERLHASIAILNELDSLERAVRALGYIREDDPWVNMVTDGRVM